MNHYLVLFLSKLPTKTSRNLTNDVLGERWTNNRNRMTKKN